MQAHNYSVVLRHTKQSQANTHTAAAARTVHTFPGISCSVKDLQQRITSVKVELSWSLPPGGELFSVVSGCISCTTTNSQQTDSNTRRMLHQSTCRIRPDKVLSVSLMSVHRHVCAELDLAACSEAKPWLMFIYLVKHSACGTVQDGPKRVSMHGLQLHRETNKLSADLASCPPSSQGVPPLRSPDRSKDPPDLALAK